MICFRTSSRGPKLTIEDEYQTLITKLAVTHSFLYQMAYSSTEEGDNERPLVIMPRELILTQEEMDYLDEYYTKNCGTTAAMIFSEVQGVFVNRFGEVSTDMSYY